MCLYVIKNRVQRYSFPSTPTILINMDFLQKLLICSDIQEDHTKEYKGEVEGLGLEILLMKEDGAKEEADNDGTSTHHRDD